MQPIKHDPPKLAFSIREACQATSIGKTALYRAISENRLRVTRIAGRTIVPAEALHAFVAGEV